MLAVPIRTRPDGSNVPFVLELDGLTRRYGDLVALDDLTFSVAPGRMCGFVGPNGAGKTTAMRIVLGVLEPDAGRVRWNGAPVDTATRSRPRLVASGAVDELRERGRGGVDRVRVRVEGDGDGSWLAGVRGAELAGDGPHGLLVRLQPGARPEAVLDAARAAGTVTHFSLERPSLADR